MAVEYNADICKQLRQKVSELSLHRPVKISRYEAGDEISYNIKEVATGSQARVTVEIEKFVGGGFAGQVYKVKITQIGQGTLKSLSIGQVCAIKILIPPSGFSQLFRNFIYATAFQAPFQLQVNPAASRAGAIYQKFIRRAAKIKFGSEQTVVDIHATLIDENFGSCGELSEWIEGRTWLLEVDENLDTLALWRKGKKPNIEKLGSLEYRTKRRFMHDFVELLREMGASELARQYEWSTCKSQPNCLKCKDRLDNQADGLVAVDFRAGLALLAILPMSPGDFELILQGLSKGKLVQFDRPDLAKLKRYIARYPNEFSDMTGMLEELEEKEEIYRNSIIDITNHRTRLLHDGKLWRTIFGSAVTGWKTRNIIDDKTEQKLLKSKIGTFIFFAIGLIPFLGRFIRRIWARPDWRKHYTSILTNFSYLKKALSAKITEKAVIWHRAGRISDRKALKISGSIILFMLHIPFSLLPAGLHRFLTDFKRFTRSLGFIFVRPLKLYFNGKLREQWLRDMIEEGKTKHILSDEDADTILGQLSEPFIQKYLVSLVVHLMTLPVTQIVSIAVAWIYTIKHPELSEAEKTGAFLGIVALFQITPISPGSICRGLYTVSMAIKDRSFKDYNIAIFLSFFKYIGYLAFPIQMTHHYPAMARFMAGHWATGAVPVVPVFGEQGALLEHWVFSLFYNWPLTIRRRMLNRAKIRALAPARYWHVILTALAGAGLFGILDLLYSNNYNSLPTLRNIWWLAFLVPVGCGWAVTIGCGGAAIWKRLSAAAVCGILTGMIYTAITAVIIQLTGVGPIDIVITGIWRIFAFCVFTAIGAIIAELKLPDPQLK